MDTAACELTRLSECAVAPRQKLDTALLQSIARGDRFAMQVLFQRHNVRIYRFVLRLIGNPSLAEEIVNEVFLDVWRRADTFKQRCEVTTWLLTIARHKAISLLRRRCEVPLDEKLAAQFADAAQTAEAILERQDRCQIVRACLTRLSPLHREIVDLVYYHGKTVDEAAAIVGAPKSTVKTRMFYARNHLAKLLKAAGLEGL